jgi:hypothetical protein
VKSIPAAGEEKLTAGLDGETAMKRLAIFSAILIPRPLVRTCFESQSQIDEKESDR